MNSKVPTQKFNLNGPTKVLDYKKILKQLVY